MGELRGARAAEEIDIQGKCLAPGFIDTHTHDDQACMAARTMEPKISQGVTTVVVGNCGVSLAPLDHPPAIPEPINLLGEPEDFRFRDFRSYFDAVDEARPSTNVIALVGHSSLRVATMVDLQRPATPAELDTMLGMLDDALRAGAAGLSTGVFYPPGRAADSGRGHPAGEQGRRIWRHLRHPHARRTRCRARFDARSVRGGTGRRGTAAHFTPQVRRCAQLGTKQGNPGASRRRPRHAGHQRGRVSLRRGIERARRRSPGRRHEGSHHLVDSAPCGIGKVSARNRAGVGLHGAGSGSGTQTRGRLLLFPRAKRTCAASFNIRRP